VFEDHEHGEVLVSAEAVVCAGLDENRGAFANGNLLTLDIQHAVAFEDHVELIVLVRLLAVRLGGNQNVDPDLETGGFVDGLIATAGLPELLLDGCDLE
jgi:hypothetical protein